MIERDRASLIARLVYSTRRPERDRASRNLWLVHLHRAERRVSISPRSIIGVILRPAQHMTFNAINVTGHCRLKGEKLEVPIQFQICTYPLLKFWIVPLTWNCLINTAYSLKLLLWLIPVPRPEASGMDIFEKNHPFSSILATGNMADDKWQGYWYHDLVYRVEQDLQGEEHNPACFIFNSNCWRCGFVCRRLEVVLQPGLAS